MHADVTRTPHARPWWATDPQRPAARLRSTRLPRLARAATALAALAVLVATAAYNPGRSPLPLHNGGVQQPPTLAALSGLCSGIASWPEPPAEEIGWVDTASGTVGWRNLPPVSGNFSPVPWPEPGFIAPDAPGAPTLSQAVADLYRGWVVIWYRTDINADVLATLQSWATGSLPAPVLVAPWPASAPAWPSSRPLLFTSWSHAQACSRLSYPAAEEFLATAATAPGRPIPLDRTGPQAAQHTFDVLRQHPRTSRS